MGEAKTVLPESVCNWADPGRTLPTGALTGIERVAGNSG